MTQDSSKAPASFSRYLLNSDLGSLLQKPISIEKEILESSIEKLTLLLDRLNETWFSFSTNLKNQKASIHSYQEITKPMEDDYSKITQTLPEVLKKSFAREQELFFEERHTITHFSNDTMSQLSGYYMNFLKLLEVSITHLTLLLNQPNTNS